jgi:hypothetical protein
MRSEHAQNIRERNKQTTLEGVRSRDYEQKQEAPKPSQSPKPQGQHPDPESGAHPTPPGSMPQQRQPLVDR